MDTNDTVATRRERLRLIVKTRYNGKQSAMVADEKVGINGGELSGLLRDRFFGEKKARKLESQLGLPPMWLDGFDGEPETDADDLDMAVAKFTTVYKNCNDEGKAWLLTTIETARKLHTERRTRRLPVQTERRKTS